jgi:hypothetical protein
MESLDRQKRGISPAAALALSMTHTDYRDALQLLESVITLIEARRARHDRLRRRLRRLSLQADLLRVALGQVPPSSQRN